MPARDMERRRASRIAWDRRVRLEAIKHYGGACACCGEIRPEFLAFDHINGGGNQHRKEVRKTCGAMHYWLKKNGWPTGFRILCHNCNLSRGFYGYCPHETERQVQQGLVLSVTGGD